MTLNQLRFAASIARTGSFTQAAAECFVTQPSLSNAVALLEDELGRKLFLRTTRKVTLTTFGEQMLPDILRVLQAQEDLESRARSILSPSRPMIRIGTSPLLNSSFLNLLFEPYRSSHSTTELVLREMNMSELQQLLQAGQLDFILGVAGTDNFRCEHTFLYQEPLLYLPRGSSPISADSVKLTDISAETFVMVPNSCGLAQTIRSLFRSHRKTLKEYSGEAMSYPILEQWAALGIGAAIVPESKLAGPRSNAAKLLDRHGKQTMLRFEAFWNPDAGKIPHLHEFVTYLKKVVPALGSGIASRPK